ncbi:IclR family transcriptional regulator [Bacillus sp. UMB0899]|nr:IclR family transcriptional regulator [Bacillus sp. UMB0899]
MTVKSALRVLQIFELLAQYPDGLTVKEMSDQLGWPQSSTFNLIKTLYNQSYLSQSSSKKYKLGANLIQLGSKALDSFDFVTDSQPYLQELMNQVEETVFMAVLSEDKVIYVNKFEFERSIRTSAYIGMQRPIYCTGLGKAFLTFLPFHEREEMLNKIELKAITPKTITDRQALEEQLSKSFEMGYTIDDEENEEGLLCMAAPVYDVSKKIKAAISVAGPKERMLLHNDNIVSSLLVTAEKISARMGYSK